jgi:ectoine hydroxylase-related dioxygenase (phytanoyl-CoA dioxygenase family)
VDEIEEQGYTLMPDLLERNEALRLGDALDRLLDDILASGRPYQGYDIEERPVIFNVIFKDPQFLALLDHPAILPIIEHFLGNDVILRDFNAVLARAGKPAQGLHLDSRLPFTDQKVVVQCIWMLDDFTEYNGATRIVLGSHKFGYAPESNKTYENTVYVTGKAGTVLVFNSALWHGTGAAVRPERRWGQVITYARWFVKPCFDFPRMCRPELYPRLNPKQKRLLGFTSIPPRDEFVRTRTNVPVDSLPPTYEDFLKSL